LEKNGTAQGGGIRAVERRKYKVRNKKSICRKLEKCLELRELRGTW